MMGAPPSPADRDDSRHATSPLSGLARAFEGIREQGRLIRRGGRVARASALELDVVGLGSRAQLGDCVEFSCGSRAVKGQVLRIAQDSIAVLPFESVPAIGLGDTAWLLNTLKLAPAPDWEGRILNALGEPIDSMGPLSSGVEQRRLDGPPPAALSRQRVVRPIRTGVSVVDIFTPLCAGQRMGIFAGSGVGKSTLLGMLARSDSFQRFVVALVGERGREVREFVEDVLGPRRSKAVVVVATGDESPMMRRQAPLTAMTIAEHFRDRGEDVLLIVDSVTRYAHALREVALAAGEPPVARGYTPSVFAELPRLLERAGPGSQGQGTITGIFSVLVDGDDLTEPVADTVRGILDGHLVLSREIASRGQFPAVDILNSISRLSDKAWTKEEAQFSARLLGLISEFEGTRDLRLLGAYKPGENANLDLAITTVPAIYAYLAQSANSPARTESFAELAKRLAQPRV